jgi:hypothetical protein
MKRPLKYAIEAIRPCVSNKNKTIDLRYQAEEGKYPKTA